MDFKNFLYFWRTQKRKNNYLIFRRSTIVPIVVQIIFAFTSVVPGTLLLRNLSSQVCFQENVSCSHKYLLNKRVVEKVYFFRQKAFLLPRVGEKLTQFLKKISIVEYIAEHQKRKYSCTTENKLRKNDV